MINIQFQLSGMIILCIITLFYFSLKRTGLRTQKFFFKLLVVSDCCAFLDIVSVFMICYKDYVPAVLVEIICKLYLFALLMVTFYGLLYICADIYAKDTEFRRIELLYRLILIVAGAMIFIMPISYLYEGNGEIVYSYGPATVVTYMMFGVLFLAMLLHLVMGRGKIYPRRRNAVYVWLIIWIGAAGLQLMNHRLLVVTYAGVVGVVIIFMLVENPESNIDKRSGMFNISAMQQYATEAYANSRSFSMIIFSVNGNYDVWDLKVTTADVFTGGGVIYFMFSHKEDMESSLREIEERFPKQKIFVIPDSLVVPNTEELFTLIRSLKLTTSREDKENIYFIDDRYVQEMVEKHEIEMVLRDAMAEGRVEVFYQPIYSTVKKCFVSAEALVRIRDKDGKIISPVKFIPVAEESGYIVELGKIIFDKVCVLMKNYQKTIGLEYIEINLSVVQGEDKKLAEDVLFLLQKYELSSDSIILEITESASVQGKEQLLNNMKVLLGNGIEFALDDFGTGQSNLDYMASMPVRIVKFDKNMTQDYFTVEKTRMIMNAAIRMVHEMGMEVVAEGIETDEQLEEMIKQGVEHIQGYYFSRPLSEEAFIRFMKKVS